MTVSGHPNHEVKGNRPAGKGRGTSNTNDRGSAAQRRKRKQWLLETYQADVRRVLVDSGGVVVRSAFDSDEGGPALPSGWSLLLACRCYRCGRLLTFFTVTVDRIIPGCQGGTYRRTNIRPACNDCNSETGRALRGKK